MTNGTEQQQLAAADSDTTTTYTDRYLDSLLHKAYAAGWCEAAQWAHRDDLACDVGSPAYLEARDEHIAELDEG